MKWTARLLRLVLPNDERERMELRHETHRAQATAEDLCRTTVTNGEAIKSAIKRANARRQ